MSKQNSSLDHKINENFSIKAIEISNRSKLSIGEIFLNSLSLKEPILCYDDCKKISFYCVGLEYTFDGIYLLEILTPEKQKIIATSKIRRIY
jgi:hypothetical protein